jgi:hypothetical protein
VSERLERRGAVCGGPANDAARGYNEFELISRACDAWAIECRRMSLRWTRERTLEEIETHTDVGRRWVEFLDPVQTNQSKTSFFLFYP